MALHGCPWLPLCNFHGGVCNRVKTRALVEPRASSLVKAKEAGSRTAAGRRPAVPGPPRPSQTPSAVPCRPVRAVHSRLLSRAGAAESGCAYDTHIRLYVRLIRVPLIRIPNSEDFKAAFELIVRLVPRSNEQEGPRTNDTKDAAICTGSLPPATPCYRLLLQAAAARWDLDSGTLLGSGLYKRLSR